MPILACTQPVTITEENWTTQARQVIISYLDENGILWIFYETMPCPDTERNRYKAMKQEAQHVDEIENLQNADFLSQRGQFSKMFRDPTVAGTTPVKKPQTQTPETSPTSATDIKWQKKPNSLHGYKEAQAALYRLLRTMAYTHFATTVDAIDPCDPQRGTQLLQHLSDVIFPVDEGSKDKSQEAYMEHRFSLGDDTNLMGWWSTLLKLQAQKAALGISDSTRGNALKDAESTIRSKIKGTTFAEFIKWQTEVNVTERTKTDKGVYPEARIQHFEIRFREWQKILDAQQPKRTAVANSVAATPTNKSPCAWCLANKGKTFTNHSEANCNNKKRAEGASPTPTAGAGTRTCFLCGSADHLLKECPKKKPVKANSAVSTPVATNPNDIESMIQKHFETTLAALRQEFSSPTEEANVSVATKDHSQYTMRLQACSHIQANSTSVQRERAMIDTAATQSITPTKSLVQDQHASEKIISCANNSLITENIHEGRLRATSKNGQDIPQLDTLVTGEATGTLLSGPDLVFGHHQSIVLSENACFMQPNDPARCPVCVPHPERISFEGSKDGFFLDLKSKGTNERVFSMQTSSLDITADEMQSLKTRLFDTPEGKDLKHKHAAADAQHKYDTADVLTPQKPASQPATAAAMVPSLSAQRKFADLHAAFGGAITTNNISEFMKLYPEQSYSMGLPATLLDNNIRQGLSPCHCCMRSKMRKTNAPPAVETSASAVGPLEEVHLDLFTYPQSPRYDAFFIDRCTRACWYYSLAKKSDLPRIVQQFIVDANTNSDYAVGQITSHASHLDAQKVNKHLEEHGCTQRIRVLFTDGAGETQTPEFEDFLTDLLVKHRLSIPESQFQNALAEANGGWTLVNMIRHDLDISGLGPSFRRFCASLNAQRMNFVPRKFLGYKSPASILYPHKTPHFRYFLPFGCHATVLRLHKDLKANKLACRGRDGIYIGTAAPYNMTGFLVYLFPERGRGAGRVIVATHAKFDKGYFPARKHEKRVHDPLSATSSLSMNDPMERQKSLHEEGTATVVEFDLDDDEETEIEEKGTTSKIIQDETSPTDAELLTSELPPINEGTNLLHTLGGSATHESTGSHFDPNMTKPSRFPELEAMILRRLEEHGHSLLTPEKFTAHEHHARTRADQDASDFVIDTDEIENQDSPEFGLDIDQIDDTDTPEGHGIKLRSGRIVTAARAIAQELGPYIQNQVNQKPIPDELKKARAFVARVRRDEARRHIQINVHSARVQATIDHVKTQAELKKRTVTDLRTGEIFDRALEQYHFIGKDDITPDGRITTAFFTRVVKKALKAEIRADPSKAEACKQELKLLSTPKSATEALKSPQRLQWLEAINKELQSLRDKDVYEVRKTPPNRKLIPTRLVLKIKLNSDGTIDKYKCRCVALGFLQRAGLDFDPDGLYSPMSAPSTTRSILALSNALDLNVDHLDVRVAYLNGILPENERFYCSPPTGFEEAPGYCWYIKRGLYGSRQGGAVWAKTFREWMRLKQPKFREAGNERCVYVFREGSDGNPSDLDTLRGIQLEPDEKIIILVMNTDDMLISYSENARGIVDEFELTLNEAYEATPRAPIEYYLGMHIQRDRKNRLLTLDARRHIYEFIQMMGLDPHTSSSVGTPLDPAITYSKADCPRSVDAALKTKILQAHGKLIHLAIWARPDLAHSVSVLGRYIHSPSLKHWDAYLRIAKYLVRTKDFRIVYGTHDKGRRLALYGFSDSDWGADLDDRKSTGAYVFFLDGASCSWKVKLSATALLSTQEAEYVALSEATKEALCLRMLLLHLGFGDPEPTTIYCDNKGAITMGLHPTNKAAMRHVDMREHFCQQHVEAGNVITPFCSTYDMVADSSSKATHKPTHTRHTSCMFGDQSIAPPVLPIQHLVAT